MSYILPTFNLTCNIFRPDADNVAAVPTTPPRIAGQACQLTYGRRVNVASSGGTGAAGIPIKGMDLLLPPRVDIRGPQDTISFDMVEAPAGSGRWYWVYYVDDIGKGFDNEHRVAGLYALAGAWLAPYS